MKLSALAFPLIALIALSYTSIAVKQPLLERQIFKEGHSGKNRLETLVETFPSLPRYEEAGYSLLGRSPVVDTVLQDPFYFPTYGEKVSNTLRQLSQEGSLLNIAKASFIAGGIPIQGSKSFSNEVEAPDAFIKALGPTCGQAIFNAWCDFLKVSKKVEELLSVVTEEEKTWLKNHPQSFFFGEKQEVSYQFFTSNSPMPFKFYEIGSRLDLAALSEQSLILAGLVDKLSTIEEELKGIDATEDFLWQEEGRTLIVSSRSGVVLNREADFFIDVGGKNQVENLAGGTGGVKPAALHIDIKGGNNYRSRSFSQGAGFLGVGVLASFSGNNHYTAEQFSQGCGYFGTGILMEKGGNNIFEIVYGGQSCALFGSSLLWEAGGNSQFIAIEGMAQAASSTLGVAFLIENGSHNTFKCGQQGQGQRRAGGIGQGGSVGVRSYPWIAHPSFYGGVSFLYNKGNDNTYEIPWIGQGSAYFMGAGIYVGDGEGDNFLADYDAQGQGLHLAAGLFMKFGGKSVYNGGWGSLGVGGDRAVGFFISTKGQNTYFGTDQSVGTSRKPKALGVFIDVEGGNNYIFDDTSNANIQQPQSPNEWSSALFLELGPHNAYPHEVDKFTRGPNKKWGVENHSWGIDDEQGSDLSVFDKFPAIARSQIPFDPIKGWESNNAYRPIKRVKSQEEVNQVISSLKDSSYEERRTMYETLDLSRFTHPELKFEYGALLSVPEQISEDLFNYAALWSLSDRATLCLKSIKADLLQNQIISEYSRGLAIRLISREKNPDLLYQILQSEKKEENQALAASYIVRLVSSDNLDPLYQLAEHPSEMVRYEIGKGMQDSTFPEAVNILKPLLRDNSFYVRRSAALSMISLGEKEGVDVMIDTFDEPTLDMTDNYGDNIFNALANYLGVDFELDKEAWIRWWKENRETFQFPHASLKKAA